MGILFWIGSFAVVLFSWGFFCFQFAPKTWSQGQEFWKNLFSLNLHQLRTTQGFSKDETQSQRQNLFRWSVRRSFLLVPLLFLSFIHLNVNPQVLLIVGACLWGISRWMPNIERRSLGLFSLGLTLWSLEASSRQVNLIFSNIEAYPFLYTLMDNSVQALAFGLLIGFIFSLVSRVQGVSLFFSVIGLISGFLSLPVAAAIFIGEILCLTWKDEGRFDSKKLSVGLDVTSMIIGVGLWSLVVIAMEGQDYSPQVRRFQFLLGAGVLLLTNIGLRSAVYHFKAQGLEK